MRPALTACEVAPSRLAAQLGKPLAGRARTTPAASRGWRAVIASIETVGHGAERSANAIPEARRLQHRRSSRCCRPRSLAGRSTAPASPSGRGPARRDTRRAQCHAARCGGPGRQNRRAAPAPPAVRAAPGCGRRRRCRWSPSRSPECGTVPGRARGRLTRDSASRSPHRAGASPPLPRKGQGRRRSTGVTRAPVRGRSRCAPPAGWRRRGPPAIRWRTAWSTRRAAPEGASP